MRRSYPYRSPAVPSRFSSAEAVLPLYESQPCWRRAPSTQRVIQVPQRVSLHFTQAHFPPRIPCDLLACFFFGLRQEEGNDEGDEGDACPDDTCCLRDVHGQ